jgi:hypothetical protein
MDEDISKYKDLINLMEETPKITASDHFTQCVMARLTGEQNLSILQVLGRTFSEAKEISWTNFVNKSAQGSNSCFYFLIAGLFFFFIGSMLFSSTFYIEYTITAMGFILLESILVLIAAISLVTGSMMMATGIPGTEKWAKRVIMIHEIMIISCAVLIAVAVKTTCGGLLAITFGITGILTGVALMKVMENRAQGNNETFTGELHNA